MVLSPGGPKTLILLTLEPLRRMLGVLGTTCSFLYLEEQIVLDEITPRTIDSIALTRAFSQV